jgi:predicted DNA-binding transcriptional regulator YafY
MQAGRLLTLMLLLQTRGRMTAPALAAELEVSTRTILRDMDQLSASGVPVWADRGREGGFQLQPGWRTQLTGLTEAEAQALFLAGVPSAAAALGLGNASASAQLKMLAALPEGLRADAQRVSDRLHIDAIDWFRQAAPPEHLQAVADAVWHQKVVHMRYESWSGVKDRVIKPLGLVLKAGFWYMAALDDRSQAARTFKLSSIQRIEVQSATFKRPKTFDLATYWQAATLQFEAGVVHMNVSLRVTVIGLERIRRFSLHVAQAVAESARLDALNPGWTRIVVPMESVEFASCQLLSLGAQVQVLGPRELVQRMSEAVDAMAVLYR